MRAVIIGFLMPIGWGCLFMVLFNARDSPLMRALWVASRVTCPAWLLNGFWGDVGSPLVNGMVYGVIAVAIFVLLSPAHPKD